MLLGDIDPDKVLAPAFGGLLFVGGLVAMLMHVRAWRRQRELADAGESTSGPTADDPGGAELDRAHFRARYRRRMQVSGLIALLGVMIAVGDAFIPGNAPLLFAVYWLVVLAGTIWVLMLAVADMFATSAHTRAAIARIRAKQRVLERQLAETARREGYDPDDFGRNGDHAG